MYGSLSVHLSNVGIVSKRLNLESRGFHHMIAQGLQLQKRQTLSDKRQYMISKTLTMGQQLHC